MDFSNPSYHEHKTMDEDEPIKAKERGRQDDDIFEDEVPENSDKRFSPKIKQGKFEGRNSDSKHHDTSNLEDSKSEDPSKFYGISKRLYKRSDNFEQPKTGTDFILLPQNPIFIKNQHTFEPVFVPKQNILEECLRREAEKICFHETLLNKVVFDCVDPSFYTKSVTPKDYDLEVLPYYIPASKDDVTLVFESRFECGNLRRAIQIYDYEYNLILKPDYFTRGHTQWYYFSVANTRKNKEYRFNIINMMKPDSLYNSGMNPLVYSDAAAKKNSDLIEMGWHRDGYDVCYYQNNMKRKGAGYYYTLTFAIKFKHDYDTVYFAHCFPYTYSDLCFFLKMIEDDPIKKNRFRRRPLCQTIAGNNLDSIVITNFNAEDAFDKKGIAITARVHPGETQSSYAVESIIDFLVGNSPQAQYLRDNFIIRVVPMLNPDGVINGNYRCGLAGSDLNRSWVDPSKKLHPTIYATKLMLRKMKEEREILLFCDIHGHSRKKNIFIYGCSGRDPKRKELMFPLLYRNNLDFFSFKDSSFIIQKDRETTARVVLWRELGINNCYTLEISFCGADTGKYEFLHFNYDLFKEIGVSFCHTMMDLTDPDQNKIAKINEEIEQIIIKTAGVAEKKDDKATGNQDDQDSDYSNEEENMKLETTGQPQSQSQPTEQTLPALNSQQGSTNGLINNGGTGINNGSQMQTSALTVINEFDDKKGKKPKKKKGGKQ